jgi:glutaredoxin 3
MMSIRSFLLCVLLLCCPILGGAERLSTGEDVDSFVVQKISENDVMVFAKSYCGFCKRTLSLLQELESKNKGAWKLGTLNLDRIGEDGPLIQMELLTRTSQKTVPNIFIGGEHIGGNSDLQELYNSGSLEKMLKDLVTAKK